MRVKLRSLLTVIWLATIAATSTALILLSFNGAILTSLGFTRHFAKEQALIGLQSLEHGMIEAQVFLKSLAIHVGAGISAKNMPEAVRRFWIELPEASYRGVSIAFVSAESGGGIICHGREAADILPLDGGAGLVAKARTGGLERPIPDMRDTIWFKQAMAEPATLFQGYQPYQLPFHEDSAKRGVIACHRVMQGGKPVGVVALRIDTGRMTRLLEASLERSVARSRVVLIEKMPDGNLNILADSSHEHDSRCQPDGNGIVTAGGIGDPLLSDALATIPESAAFFEEIDPSHREFRSLAGNYFANFMNVRPGKPPAWAVCALINADDILAPLGSRIWFDALVMLMAMGLAAGIAIWMSAGIAKPIERVTRVARDVGNLRFEAVEAIGESAIAEVDELSKATDSMRSGIKAFLRYLPEKILRNYLTPGSMASTGGEIQTVTILFSDIRDFSAITERSEPMALINQLNEYFEIISSLIAKHGGTLDKYIGDAIMAFWNAPDRVPLHARQACAVVLEGRKTFHSTRERWKREGLPQFHTRVGIHTGEVIVGNIGSSVRLNYTIIGDSVNLASRLEALNKEYGTSILISESTRAEAGDEFLTRPVDLVAVKGKTVPILVHELIGLRAEESETMVDLARLTTEALGLYQARDFTRAGERYSAILAKYPDDTLSRIMAGRCAKLESDPPPAEWSGVFRYNTK